MSETKFTPGPWSYQAAVGEPGEVFYHSIHSAPETPGGFANYVASTWGGPHEANAHLIAAAPDLYAALERLHGNIAEYARINNLGGFDNQDMQQARAALAKARGEIE